MSSTYYLPCLNHDPAITTGGDYRSAEEAFAAVRSGEYDAAHPNCDMIVGRYSYPLVEAYCDGSKCRRRPHNIAGYDKDLLVLLHAAMTAAPDPAITEALTSFSWRCWPFERLDKLRLELGIVQREPAAAPAQPGDSTRQEEA